jgi:hypothetical protein
MEALKDKEHKNMHRWEDNIKMEFNETRGGSGWTAFLSLWLGTSWWVPVNKIIKLRVS